MAFDRNWRRIAWLILGIGVLILAGGLALGQGKLRLLLYGEKAMGEVTEIRRNGDMYVPVVRFRLTGGESREVEDLGSGAPDFAVGDRVTILYAPENPDTFSIATFDRLWLPTVMVAGFGCLWLVFGAVAWALSRNVDLFILGERAFATIALGAAIVGVLVTRDALSLYRGGVRTEGTVTEIRVSHYTEQEDVTLSSGRQARRDVERTSYAPLVHFVAGDGRKIEFLGRGGTGTSYSAGDRVTLVYDPANPIRARILSFSDLWLPPVVTWGVVLIFGGAVALSRWTRLRARVVRGV